MNTATERAGERRDSQAIRPDGAAAQRCAARLGVAVVPGCYRDDDGATICGAARHARRLGVFA